MALQGVVGPAGIVVSGVVLTKSKPPIAPPPNVMVVPFGPVFGRKRTAGNDLIPAARRILSGDFDRRNLDRRPVPLSDGSPE